MTVRTQRAAQPKLDRIRRRTCGDDETVAEPQFFRRVVDFDRLIGRQRHALGESRSRPELSQLGHIDLQRAAGIDAHLQSVVGKREIAADTSLRTTDRGRRGDEFDEISAVERQRFPRRLRRQWPRGATVALDEHAAGLDRRLCVRRRERERSSGQFDACIERHRATIRVGHADQRRDRRRGVAFQQRQRNAAVGVDGSVDQQRHGQQRTLDIEMQLQHVRIEIHAALRRHDGVGARDHEFYDAHALRRDQRPDRRRFE